MRLATIALPSKRFKSAGRQLHTACFSSAGAWSGQQCVGWLLRCPKTRRRNQRRWGPERCVTWSLQKGIDWFQRSQLWPGRWWWCWWPWGGVRYMRRLFTLFIISLIAILHGWFLISAFHAVIILLRVVFWLHRRRLLTGFSTDHLHNFGIVRRALHNFLSCLPWNGQWQLSAWSILLLFFNIRAALLDSRLLSTDFLAASGHFCARWWFLLFFFAWLAWLTLQCWSLAWQSFWREYLPGEGKKKKKKKISNQPLTVHRWLMTERGTECCPEIRPTLFFLRFFGLEPSGT